jgi:hypothetical protein
MATQVYLSVNSEKHDLNTARLAIKDANTWMVLGDGWQLYSLHSFAPMPAVNCKVVDLSRGHDDKALQAAFAAYMVHRNLARLEKAVSQSIP